MPCNQLPLLWFYLFFLKVNKSLSLRPIWPEDIVTVELMSERKWFGTPSCVWLQNCLVRWEGSVCSAIVGDFGLAEKIPDYRWVPTCPFSQLLSAVVIRWVSSLIVFFARVFPTIYLVDLMRGVSLFSWIDNYSVFKVSSDIDLFTFHECRVPICGDI